MSTSGGKKRGPHARMLVEGMGGAAQAGLVVPPRQGCRAAIVASPGDGLHARCGCVCALCAHAMHLADTYQHVHCARSPVMRCVSSQLPAWRAAAAAMVTSAGRESASPLKAWPSS